MPKMYTSLFCCLLLSALAGGLMSPSARAQAGGSDSTRTPAATTTPATSDVRVVERGALVPSGVSSVRQRIRNIGPGQQRQVRVITPMIVMPSQQATMEVVGPDGVTRTVPVPGGTGGMDPLLLQLAEDNILRRIDSRFDELYDELGRPRPNRTEIALGDDSLGGDSLVAGLDTTAQADTMALPPLAEEVTEPEETPPVETTPRAVEREMLETGLFRAVDVNFEFNESTLLSESETALGAIGEVLTNYPTLQIEIGGHTDSVGPDGYNLVLSQRRAETVRDFLVEQFGIAPSRLVATGYGEARPVASNANSTGRTLNRRVEFSATGVTGPQGRAISPGDTEARRDAVLQEILRELREIRAEQNQN